MGSLVGFISDVTDASYGVSILDVAPPSSSSGSVSRIVGIIGDFPWGPVNTPTICYGTGDFFATFCPLEFPTALTGNEAMKAMIGKKFPGPMVICRIDATDAVARSSSYTVTGGAFVGTVPYKGIAGNDVTIVWAAATDADAAHRNLTISIGTAYSVTYENVTLTTLLTLGDRFITWTATSSPSVLPAAAVAATSTTAGAAGTAVAGDYVGTSSSNKGIRTFYADNVKINVLFVAECPSALVAAVNAGLKAWTDDAGKTALAVLCSVASQSASAAATYASTYKNTLSKTVGCWPRVKGPDLRDPLQPTITVDGNAFMAIAMVAVPPWKSPEGVNSVAALSWITALETDGSTKVAYDAIKNGGMSAFFIEDTLGPIVRGAVTTNTASGQENIVRSMYRAYVADALATRGLQYIGVPLQVDLTAKKLGSAVSPLVDSVTSFCEDESVKQHIFPIAPATKPYVVDAFGLNTAGDISDGQWQIAVGMSLPPPLRKLIFALQVSSTGLTVSSS